jgi:hypothetical protein
MTVSLLSLWTSASDSNFLNDKKDFRVSTLIQLADALGKKLE